MSWLSLLANLFSIVGLLIAVAVTVIAFWFLAPKVRVKRDVDDMVKYLLPTLAFVIAIFSYGSSAVTVEQQQLSNKERNEQLAAQVKAFEEQNRILKAELYGLSRFQATHDRNWNVTLKKIGGEVFEVENLVIIANYQLDRDEGPISGKPVPVMKPSYGKNVDEGHHIFIANAREKFCTAGEPVCEGKATLRVVYFRFKHNGEDYRVVSTLKEK